MIGRKRKGTHISINVRVYVDHTWKKRKNPVDNKKKSIIMTNNFKGKTPRLDKVIGIEQSPIESAVKLTQQLDVRCCSSSTFHIEKNT
jgi:hypothetical protein